MSDLEFGRAAVGVNAKKDWIDAETLGRLAGRIDLVETSGTATPVGEYLTDGATALEAAVARCFVVAHMIVAECSDATAILGSGQEAAIENMDATETAGTDTYNHISQRLGGPPWKQPI